MLILFDIDGTLLLTCRAGLRGMQAACHELYGEHVSVEGVDFAGRLDTNIWEQIAQRHDIDATIEHENFRIGYARHLRRLFESGAESNLLPGVAALVEALHARADVTLGLLTGNYPETGRMKIEASGLEMNRFPIAAWGDDGAERRDLPPVAMERFEAGYGRSVAPEQVVVIGDTIHDVTCAKAHGCRALAVDTGPRYDLAEMEAAGADLALADLSDTDRVMDWLTNTPAPVSE